MDATSHLFTLPAVTESLVTTFLLVMLLVIAVAVAVSESVVNIIVATSVFSLLMASIFTTLQAPDVALTEAVVGAGISTLLAMATCVVGDIDKCKNRNLPYMAILATMVLASLLLYATLDMPPFGDAANPAHQRIAPYYIRYAYEDTGISNVVTVILAGYRGYDTLGESVVVLIAGLGVLFLLGNKQPNVQLVRPEATTPIRVMTIVLLPAIILCAFYIQFHGDVGPGGAFQAGILFAVAAALYTLVVGYEAAAEVFSKARILTLAGLGIFIYAGVGLVGMLMGGNFLEYGVLHADAKLAQHTAIFLVELGIACNVSAVMTLIFQTIVSYPPAPRHEKIY